MMTPVSPSLRFEKALYREGVTSIVAVDEVGRGALAGPGFVVGAWARVPRDGCRHRIRMPSPGVAWRAAREAAHMLAETSGE
jgi:hypothetical protein